MLDTSIKYLASPAVLAPCSACVGVCLSLSGEELAVLPSEELPDVRTLKKVLHRRHGAPLRFRQAIFV